MAERACALDLGSWDEQSSCAGDVMLEFRVLCQSVEVLISVA